MEQSKGTRDGFLLARDHFLLPKEAMALDPKTMRALTICNLFVNHRLAFIDIVRVLDENTKNVILSLLEHGVVQDRRARPRQEHLEKERKRIFHPSS
jgi:hypothetical protein